MRKIVMSVIAAAAIVNAAPALAQQWGAQPWGGERPYADSRLFTPHVDGLEWRINHAAEEGRISWGEQRRLMDEFKQVQPIAWRVQTGQASGWETERLARAVDRIERAVDEGGAHWRSEGRRGRFD